MQPIALADELQHALRLARECGVVDACAQLGQLVQHMPAAHMHRVRPRAEPLRRAVLALHALRKHVQRMPLAMQSIQLGDQLLRARHQRRE